MGHLNVGCPSTPSKLISLYSLIKIKILQRTVTYELWFMIQKKQTTTNQILVSQVPNNEQFPPLEITRLPVGKQLIEALAKAPTATRVPLCT